MKARTFSFASCLAVLALAVISFASCSDDDDGINGANLIVGTWVREGQDNSTVFGVRHIEEYHFSSDKTGYYHNGIESRTETTYSFEGTSGNFTYTITPMGDGTWGSLYLKIKFINTEYNSFWKDEYTKSYQIKNKNELHFDGRIYIKKLPKN